MRDEDEGVVLHNKPKMYILFVAILKLDLKIPD